MLVQRCDDPWLAYGCCLATHEQHPLDRVLGWTQAVHLQEQRREALATGQQKVPPANRKRTTKIPSRKQTNGSADNRGMTGGSNREIMVIF